MSFQHVPGVGMVHFNEVRRPRVVPAHERHKWNRIPKRGQTARCIKCGCLKCFREDYNVVYRLTSESPIVMERPACTGKRDG
jgi:hypothetical protein